MEWGVVATCAAVLPCFGTGDDKTGDDWLELVRVVGTYWSGELLRLVRRWCGVGKTTGGEGGGRWWLEALKELRCS